jgi:hypothetical protein
MTDSLIKQVHSFPIPKNRKQLRSFLGKTGFFQNLIPEYGKIADILTDLTSKDVPFIWKPNHEHAMKKLKILCNKEQILAFPNYSIPFRLYCDSSGYAIGAVLTQTTIQGEKIIF